MFCFLYLLNKLVNHAVVCWGKPVNVNVLYFQMLHSGEILQSNFHDCLEHEEVSTNVQLLKRVSVHLQHLVDNLRLLETEWGLLVPELYQF